MAVTQFACSGLSARNGTVPYEGLLQTFLLASSLLFSSLAIAQTVSFQDLHVEKKSADATGPAVITVDGKQKRLAQHALQAWPVMNGQNALVLVLHTKKNATDEYHLRFYEGISRKYRDLGTIVLRSATLTEHKLNDGSWVFILSGNADAKPAIVVAGLTSVHGLLEGAHDPKLDGDALTFTAQSGETKTLPLYAFLATQMTDIYSTGPGNAQYVQFQRDGTAVLEEPTTTSYQTAKWRTDGENMIVIHSDGQRSQWPRTALSPVSGVPAGSHLNLRLLEPLDSASAKEGDPVGAVLISTATINNSVLIPQGSEFEGHLTKAQGVGWALKHETAALTLEFDTVKLPDSTSLPIHTRLYQVENSREAVNNGTVQGVRSTGTPGHSAESKVASVAALDPVAYLFTTTAATAALGFAEPEILYPAGTEMLVEFTAPVVTSKTYPRTVPEFPGSESDQRKLAQMVRNLPFRTMTKGSNKPSDLTNLVFVGPPRDCAAPSKQPAGGLSIRSPPARRS